MVARPDTKDYGSLTLFVSFYTKPEIILKVPKTVFMPQPKIDSSVIRLTIKDELPDTNRESFFKLVRAAFSKRRKTLINALSTYGLEADKDELRAALVRAGIDETVRGEDLALEDYVRLARELPKL